jgi:hypothetical protein
MLDLAVFITAVSCLTWQSFAAGSRLTWQSILLQGRAWLGNLFCCRVALDLAVYTCMRCFPYFYATKIFSVSKFFRKDSYLQNVGQKNLPVFDWGLISCVATSAVTKAFPCCLISISCLMFRQNKFCKHTIVLFVWLIIYMLHNIIKAVWSVLYKYCELSYNCRP